MKEEASVFFLWIATSVATVYLAVFYLPNVQCRIVQATAFKSFSRFLRFYVARRGENLMFFFLISHSITCFTNGADNESGEEGAIRHETAESRQRESLHWSVH